MPIVNTSIDLSNKIILLSGACGILGSRFSQGYIEAGAQLIMLDKNNMALQQLKEKLASNNYYPLETICADVTDPQQVNHLIERIIHQYEHIDVLHNNTATKSDHLKAFFEPFETYDYAEWKTILTGNLDSYFLMAQAVGRHMRQQKKGSIIQTASIYGELGTDHRIYSNSDYLGDAINTPAVYAASKAAILGLTRHLACYWGAENIRVNSISPGGVFSGQNDHFVKQYSQRIPMGRMAEADEIVGAALFLASDASSYITGQNLMIDGGLSAW